MWCFNSKKRGNDSQHLNEDSETRRKRGTNCFQELGLNIGITVQGNNEKRSSGEKETTNGGRKKTFQSSKESSYLDIALNQEEMGRLKRRRRVLVQIVVVEKAERQLSGAVQEETAKGLRGGDTSLRDSRRVLGRVPFKSWSPNEKTKVHSETLRRSRSNKIPKFWRGVIPANMFSPGLNGLGRSRNDKAFNPQRPKGTENQSDPQGTRRIS